MDIGCYAVSASRFLLEAEPLRVISLAPTTRRSAPTSSPRPSSTSATRRGVFTVGTQTFPFQVVIAAGTGGRITVQLPFNAYPDVPARVTVAAGLGERELSFPPVDQYGLEVEAFSRAIREGPPAPTPPEDAVANMKVLDALARSARSGAWEAV